MQVKASKQVEFAVNGLTKSGSVLYINIPAKIRPLLKKNAIYKVTLEEISDMEVTTDDIEESP